MRFLPHVHRDPDWQQVGIWSYAVCRCGAVRVWLYAINLMGPCAPGWSHLLVNRNGVHVNDSGWHKGTGLTKPSRDDNRPPRKPPPGPGAGGRSAALAALDYDE